jgi:uncharacterized membrane protein
MTVFWPWVRPLLLLSSLCACGSKTNPGGNCALHPAPVSFASLQTTVLSTCTPCHSKNASNRFGAPTSVNFDTHADAMDHDTAANMDIISGRMPPNAPLSAELRCVYDAWIKNDETP